MSALNTASFDRSPSLAASLRHDATLRVPMHQAAPVAFLRWGLAGLFGLAGLGKITNIDGTRQFFVSTFEKTWLPAWSVDAYAAGIGFVQVGLALALVIGWKRNWVLLAALATMLSLQFGQVVLQQWPTVSANTIYIALFGLVMFMHRFDAWTVDGLLARPDRAGEGREP